MGGYGGQFGTTYGSRFVCDPNHNLRYRVPDGLAYPPPSDVPAVIQYPYYTTKGPDDFFLN
jgi:hypothetical protein